MSPITALIADDEPLLREHLRSQLANLWPSLILTPDARNGMEVLELFETHQPQIVFLDVRMPGMDGISAARALARRAHIVFITAYEQYAVQAFEQGAIDYLLKPLEPKRLSDTIARLQERVSAPFAANAALDALLKKMSAGSQAAPRKWLQWIKASVGSGIRLIPVEEVAFLRAEDKYTLVAWGGGEALIRKGIKELSEELDPDTFVQIHRSAIVNLHYVQEVVRGVNETADVHLRGRPEVLPVSRSYLHHFRQM
ncbi:LytTR family DNA-binding domain-containing protein [Pseudoduganella ginsengisoli]|uniref:Response regulator n=1 Tax=Pseudoduganella ginsengisoli TaxID=1462440 RepID=A0A6L6PT72_9BURK|nr:LytTR family DNA-binding domain-containing protein [Pseudoduganella ginsengisoli]MTW00665.1 response regulator [Pseudoduganella ginsengisoli]